MTTCPAATSTSITISGTAGMRCSRPPPDGRFYPWQLEGARVTTEDGRLVGRVTGVEHGGAQDLWVVAGDGREHLIPAVPDIVLDVDVAAGRVVIRPPEGLLDL